MQDYSALLGNTFTNIQQIGAGGGGTVFKAYHTRLEIDVVLKKIHTNVLKSIDSKAERDILKALKHPCIPQIYDFIASGEDIFTVMEYIPGYSFAQLLEQGQRFRQRDVIKWANQLCEVVAYLHSQKRPIIHCDIKPANVMLTPKGNICLIDFNISGVRTEEGISSVGYSDGYSPVEQFRIVVNRLPGMRQRQESEITDDVTEICEEDNTTEIYGETDDATEIYVEDEVTEIDEEYTVSKDGGDKCIGIEYRMPEMNTGKSLLRSISDENWPLALKAAAALKGFPVLDERTDIYSIGATLYHILTGKKPAPFYLPYIPVRKANRGISESFAYIIDKSLSLKPEDRFQSSRQLRNTVQNMSNIDRRYKSLVRKQCVVTAGMIFLAFLSALSVTFGRKRMEMERQSTYNRYIDRMEEARSSKNYTDISQPYQLAVQLVPENQEAYYEMAMSYYEQADYQSCIRFLYDNVFSNSFMIPDTSYSRFYYLCGRCYLEQEEYPDAIKQYETAITLQSDTSSYYSDYVIALARDGRISRAQDALRQAETCGVTGDILSLLQGEIALAKEDYPQAEEALEECIRTAEDDYTLLRAYFKLDEVYQMLYQEQQQYEKRISLLTEALSALPEEEQITLIERLAQVYIDYGSLTGETRYDQKAIDLFRLTEERGTATFTGRLNIAVLYEKDEEYEQAKNQLLSMLEDFPDNYVVYKRLAFLELNIQNEREINDRNYYPFKEYYEQTKELYSEYKGTEDTEMLLLEQLYQDVAGNGWLS